MERKTAWNDYKKKELKKMNKLCDAYREFLDNGKTAPGGGGRLQQSSGLH